MRSGLRHQSRTEASPLMSVVCWTHRTRASSITNKLSSQDAYHLYASVRTAANIWNESSFSIELRDSFLRPFCVMVCNGVAVGMASVECRTLSLSLCVVVSRCKPRSQQEQRSSERTESLAQLYHTLLTLQSSYSESYKSQSRSKSHSHATHGHRMWRLACEV